MACTWTSEDSLKEWILDFPCCGGPSVGVGVKSNSDFKFGSRRLYPPSHLSSLYHRLFGCTGNKEIMLKNLVRAPIYPHIFFIVLHIYS